MAHTLFFVRNLQLLNKSCLLYTSNKVSGVDNYDNTNKDMLLENDCVDIDSHNEILERAEDEKNEMIVCIESERECRTVSYTHLDVYKRQII